MKRIGGMLLSLLAVWALSGCGSDDDGNDESALKSVSIFYNDGTVFGKTCSKMFESGFNICDISNGGVIGFMRFDGLVYNTGGQQVGQCQGNYDMKTLLDPGQSVDGDCIFPFGRGEGEGVPAGAGGMAMPGAGGMGMPGGGGSQAPASSTQMSSADSSSGSGLSSSGSFMKMGW